MKNKNIINAWDEVLPDNEVKERIFSNIQKKSRKESKRHIYIPKRILATVTAVIIMAGLVNIPVVTAMVNEVITNVKERLFFIPGTGFTQTESDETEHDAYALPEIIEFGGAVIETIMRVKDPATGQSSLAIVITEDLFNSDSVDDWNANMISRKDRIENNLRELTVTTPDGEQYIIPDNGKTGVIGNSQIMQYLYEDFPEINKFTLSGYNGYGNYISEEIVLEASTFEECYGYAESDGISIKMMQSAKNSRILIWEIEDKNFDLNYIFGEDNNFRKDFFVSISVYDETGSNLTEGGHGGSSSWGGIRKDHHEYFMILDKRPEGKIEKAVIKTVTFRIRQVKPYIYADIDIPVPEDGEIIRYDDPLVIYNNNGITSMIDQIEREGDKLIVTSYQRDIYKGVKEDEIKDFKAGFGNPIQNGWGVREKTDGDTRVYEFDLSKENIANQSTRLILSQLEFEIDGEWEIYFGE